MGSVLVSFEPLILILHFFTAFFLITTILLQAGKGTDIGSMFGAGSSQSLFGARGAATFLTKLTTITALVFLVTSLSLATISNFQATGGGTSSVFDNDTEVKKEAPATDKALGKIPNPAETTPQPGAPQPAGK
jgi:preprotein translocase subunit SecG